MTEKRRVVVPFERPAAYWATRARRHYAPSRLPDAARLMRKALEKSGDPGMAVELARIYQGMGCCTAAERCLLRAVARRGLTGDACYLIGRCALDRGDEDLAERAMEMSLRLDPMGPYAEQAQDTLEWYPWTWQDTPRRGARGEVLLGRAHQALAEGNAEAAKRLARRAWKKSRAPRIALFLGAMEETERSVDHLAYAVRHMSGVLRPRLLLAAALHRAGQEEEAGRQLALSQVLCDTLAQTEDFCAMAWEMKRYDAALALISRRLEDFPASVDDLRLKYLTLRRMGEEEAAARTLALLSDIDPDDAAGLWYRRHPEDLRLYPGRMVLLTVLGAQIRAVPGRLTPGPLNRLLHLLVMMLAEDDVDTQTIYRLIPPLWRMLPECEKRACDQHRSRHYPLAFALYVLIASGNEAEARELYARSPGKRRLLRTLRRFARWMSKE